MEEYSSAPSPIYVFFVLRLQPLDSAKSVIFAIFTLLQTTAIYLLVDKIFCTAVESLPQRAPTVPLGSRQTAPRPQVKELQQSE
ncbi:hypothetical protein MED193_22301 [Roseobacter sp. MED193]|nr:hypothetical protein MED193_22301 [Roseobacter sp. MED193]